MSLFCFHMYYSEQKLYESKVVKTLSYTVHVLHSFIHPYKPRQELFILHFRFRLPEL